MRGCDQLSTEDLHADRDLVLHPAGGAAAGLAAAAVMLLAAAAAGQRVAPTVTEILSTIGATVAPEPWRGLLSGGAAVCVTAAVLGALHAACQQRAPTRGLIAVG